MADSFVADVRLDDSVKADIQGFATSGYGHLPSVAYLFAHFHEASGACGWIADLIPETRTAVSWRKAKGEAKDKPESALNLAFTHEGLAVLGLKQPTLCSFPTTFREGMAEPSRAAYVLSDTGESTPESWEFGGPGMPAIHVCILLHASSDEVLETLAARHLRLIASTNGGVVLVPKGDQRGYRPENRKEHFGFNDGIAQPDIVGIKGEPGNNCVPTGNFLLGYPDHYGMVAGGPIATAGEDHSNSLPALANPFHGDRGLRDLGRNGTYVVYRKMEQHVASFWRFIGEEAESMKAATGAGDTVSLAAKLVGRWPSGAPLALFPNRDDAASGNRDDFLYSREDPAGQSCPFGAHIRRTNPRDMLRPNEPEQSLNLSRAHRIRRQGSIYGSQLDFGFLEGDMDRWAPALAGSDERRGVHFLAINANIERQFELIQQQWMNNPSFNGVSDNPDPIAGARSGSAGTPSQMTIPTANGPWQTKPLPSFVTIRGGAYLFLPSIPALHFLAALRSDTVGEI